MWTLPKKHQFLPKTSLLRIRSLYVKERNYKAKTRLLAAIHRKQGKSIDELAYLVNAPRDTEYESCNVERIQLAYKEEKQDGFKIDPEQSSGVLNPSRNKTSRILKICKRF